MQAGLAVFAGVVLLIQGFWSAGVLPRLPLKTGGAGCLSAKGFAILLNAPGWWTVFLGGMANGLLPCGMVYAYLALAAGSGDMLEGTLTMALFGLGTVPALLLVGSGGSLLSLTRRRHLVRAAAWCVVLTGVLSLARGLSAFSSPENHPEKCPMCQPQEMILP
jgi:sulfite exporter TauE/SafE